MSAGAYSVGAFLSGNPMSLRDNDAAADGTHWGGVLAWRGWGCGLLALSVWVWHRSA